MTFQKKITQVAEVMELGFSLPNEIIKVQFVVKQRGSIVNPEHVAYAGMLEGAIREFIPKKSRHTFKYVQVLEKHEQDALEDIMGLEKNALSLYKESNNYWDDIKIPIGKDGIRLDLSSPTDYIKYKVLLTYTNTIATSLAELKVVDKATFMFVIVRPGEQDSEEVMTYNFKKEAYSIASKLEASKETIKEFLYLYGIRVASDISTKWLIARLGKIVEEDPQTLVDIYSSKDYSTRAIIARGVLSGVIKDVNGAYTLEDGIELCSENESPSLTNAIKFLSNPNNTDLKNRILAKIG